MVRPDRILMSFILLLAFSGHVLVAQEDERLVGSWRGGLEVGGGASLPIVFRNISGKIVVERVGDTVCYGDRLLGS